jgi:hypothetical protein
MARAYSQDLRERVVEASMGGLSAPRAETIHNSRLQAHRLQFRPRALVSLLRDLMWYAAIHLVFVTSGVFMALTDRIAEGGHQAAKEHGSASGL